MGLVREGRMGLVREGVEGRQDMRCSGGTGDRGACTKGFKGDRPGLFGSGSEHR